MANKFTELSGRILVLVTGGASVALALLDLFGILDLAWLGTEISKVILLITGLIAGYLAFETTGKLDKIESRIDVALRSSEVRRFDKIGDVLAHVRRLMEGAHVIEDLTWGPPIMNQPAAQQREYAEYRKQIVRLSSRQDLRYREVMTFPTLERVLLAEQMLNESLPAYQIRYYDDAGMPPLMRFILIDDEAIFVHHSAAGLPEEGAVWVAVRDLYILQMLKVYYAEVWSEAKPLDKTVLNSFRAQLTAKQN